MSRVYEQLQTLLEEREYHGDKELQALFDSLGIEIDDLEERCDNLSEENNALLVRKIYGGGYERTEA